MEVGKPGSNMSDPSWVGLVRIPVRGHGHSEVVIRYPDSHEAEIPESRRLASSRNIPQVMLVRNVSDPQRGPENRKTPASLSNAFHLLRCNIEEFESIDAPGGVANCSIDLRTRDWFQLDQVSRHQDRNGRSGNPAFADLNTQSVVRGAVAQMQFDGNAPAVATMSPAVYSRGITLIERIRVHLSDANPCRRVDVLIGMTVRRTLAISRYIGGNSRGDASASVRLGLRDNCVKNRSLN